MVVQSKAQKHIEAAFSALDSAAKVINHQFWRINEPSWAGLASFTLLLIYLRDALYILDHLSLRVEFKEDLSGGDDITKRITDLRNVACHKTSPLNSIKVGSSSGTFGLTVAFGKHPPLMNIGGQSFFESRYDDDAMLAVGGLTLYLRRHLIRAVVEAEDRLRIAASTQGMKLDVFRGDSGATSKVRALQTAPLF